MWYQFIEALDSTLMHELEQILVNVSLLVSKDLVRNNDKAEYIWSYFSSLQ